MRRAPKAGNKLVHDSHARANKFVLRFLAELSQFRAVDGKPALAEQRKTRGNFDGGRRTQSSSQGNISGDIDICSSERLSRLAERPSHTQRIVGPMPIA